MKDISYITFHDADCILIEEKESFSLLLKNTDDIEKIRPHFEQQKFFLEYEGVIGFNSIAFIERMSFEMNYSIKLFPQYLINRCHVKSFTSFELTGEAVDDFFSPSGFFYGRKRAGINNNLDLLYNNQIADSWTITFEGKAVNITLSFGDVLLWGVASDLMLHSKLTIEFEQTSDVSYIYRLYCVIVRFFQIIRYDTKQGKLRVDLYDTSNKKKSHNGYLQDFGTEQWDFCRGNNEVEFGCYRPYIQKFFQFAADNTDYTFYHYPVAGIRYRGRHYSIVDYINIFAAFESECHSNEKLYEEVDTSRVQVVKDRIVLQMESYSRENMEPEEISFLKNARNRILQLGTQFGQKQKIVNAYHVLKEALDESIEYIFYLPEFRLKGPLQEKNLETIAGFLAKKRGAIAHGDFSGAFTDVEAQKIRFLEILTYAQMLKRVGLKDVDIERVVGTVFNCNFVLSQEQYS